jgi:hypothetical protein
MKKTTNNTLESEKTAICQVIHNAIGWALTKDFDLLFGSVAQDEEFFIFHPDSASTITGFNAFKNLAEKTWANPKFKATRYEIRELNVHLSNDGSVAWYSCYLDDYGEWNGRETGWSNARWTGVLEKREGRWVLTQMHFSFPTDRAEN